MPAWMTWVELSPDGSLLAIARSEGGVALWDLERGAIVATLGPPAQHVNFVRFSPDGSQLASGRFDGMIDVFDAQTFRQVASLDGREDGGLRGLVYSPGGEHLVSAGPGGPGVRLWDVAHGASRVVAKEKGDRRTTLLVLADLIATGWANGDVSVWRPKDGGYVHDGTLNVSGRPVNCAAASPGARLAAFGADQGGGVGVYVPGEWPCLGKVSIPRPMSANALSFSPDGQRLAAACSDGVIRVVELGPLGLLPGDPELTLLAELRAHKDAASYLVYADWLSERGRDKEAEFLRLRAAHVGKEPTEASVAAIRDAALFVPESWITALSDPEPAKGARFFDRTLGKLRWKKEWAQDAIVSGVCFLPDGKRLVSSQFDGAVRFFTVGGFLADLTLRPVGTGWTVEAEGETQSGPATDLWQRVWR
jgi:uncharacterized protein (TIGR02996 family)